MKTERYNDPDWRGGYSVYSGSYSKRYNHD